MEGRRRSTRRTRTRAAAARAGGGRARSRREGSGGRHRSRQVLNLRNNERRRWRRGRCDFGRNCKHYLITDGRFDDFFFVGRDNYFVRSSLPQIFLIQFDVRKQWRVESECGCRGCAVISQRFIFLLKWPLRDNMRSDQRHALIGRVG